MGTIGEALLGVFLVSLLVPAWLFWKYVPRSSPGSGAYGFQGMAIGLILALFGSAIAPNLGLISLGILAVAMVCAIANVSTKWGRRGIVATSLVLTLGLLASWGSVVWGIKSRLDRQRVVSLANRLDYEQPLRAQVDMKGVREPWQQYYQSKREPPLDLIRQIPVSDGVQSDEWLEMEHAMIKAGHEQDGYYRSRSFQTLLYTHRGVEHQFRKAAGFGVGRSTSLSYRHWRLDLPDRSLIPSRLSNRAFSGEVIDQNMTSVGVDYTPWHVMNTVQFAHPSTLGAVAWDWEAQRADLSKSAGFLPHGFGEAPQPPARTGVEADQWKIDALQLVSLLKHRQGAAYISDHLPNMSELPQVPTRQLTPLETEAIAKLREGEELIVRGGETQLRMVGAIRAGYQCLECHQVARGTLLGAFTYRLSKQVVLQQNEE